MAPGLPFSYRFLNESFDEMYRAEQRVGTIALIFSVLAIFIACLGIVWFGNIYCRTTHKRNWYTKSARRKC